MKKLLFLIPLTSVFILLSLVGLILLQQSQKTNQRSLKSTLINNPFPDTKILSLSETIEINLKSKIGDPFLVNFFSSWCLPCKIEAGNLETLSERIKIIGISYKDIESDTIKFLQEFGNPYENIGVDHNGHIAIDWGVYGVPETFLINNKGLVILRHAGPITEDVLKKLLIPKLKEIGL